MLYFRPFDLRLRPNEKGEHVIEHCGTVTKTFSSEKKAVAYYYRVRDELEKTLPPSAEMSQEERRELLENYLADNPTPRNSLNENAPKKPSSSRRFG
jgi:dsDNA-binding SOS-regulon protein